MRIRMQDLFIEIITVAIFLTEVYCIDAKNPHFNDKQTINLSNFQKLASLSPDQLRQMYRYLENPYIATALVERDRRKENLVNGGVLPPMFEGPLENADLQNQIMRRNGRPITLEEAVKDPILGPYFGGQVEEDSTSVRLKI